MLRVQNLSTGYGRVTVVRDVNIEVEKGEIVSIIGRNGVGKSTFVKCIMGLLKTFTGKIIFHENDITDIDSFKRAHFGIGYVPQGHGTFPRLTVQENLMMGESINIAEKTTDYEVIYNYFPRLKDRLQQKAGTLSGGEQAQLAIGRALVGHPKLLLLDEPSEGIQPNIIKQISDNLLQINKDLGLTILFVEQNIQFIQSMADRCYAMDRGGIIGEHASDELTLENIKHYLTV